MNIVKGVTEATPFPKIFESVPRHDGFFRQKSKKYFRSKV